MKYELFFVKYEVEQPQQTPPILLFTFVAEYQQDPSDTVFIGGRGVVPLILCVRVPMAPQGLDQTRQEAVARLMQFFNGLSKAQQ